MSSVRTHFKLVFAVPHNYLPSCRLPLVFCLAFKRDIADPRLVGEADSFNHVWAKGGVWRCLKGGLERRGIGKVWLVLG